MCVVLSRLFVVYLLLPLSHSRSISLCLIVCSSAAALLHNPDSRPFEDARRHTIEWAQATAAESSPMLTPLPSPEHTMHSNRPSTAELLSVHNRHSQNQSGDTNAARWERSGAEDGVDLDWSDVQSDIGTLEDDVVRRRAGGLATVVESSQSGTVGAGLSVGGPTERCVRSGGIDSVGFVEAV